MNFSLTGLSPSLVGLSMPVLLKTRFLTRRRRLYPDTNKSHDPACATLKGFNTQVGLGYSHFARRYFGNRGCFLFLGLLRWFSSPRWRHSAYVFSRWQCGMTRTGLPHSEIPGSKLVCSSPRLNAAYHVLHRLSTPRHSPYALNSLNRFHYYQKMPLLSGPIFYFQRTTQRP